MVWSCHETDCGSEVVDRGQARRADPRQLLSPRPPRTGWMSHRLSTPSPPGSELQGRPISVHGPSVTIAGVLRRRGCARASPSMSGDCVGGGVALPAASCTTTWSRPSRLAWNRAASARARTSGKSGSSDRSVGVIWGRVWATRRSRIGSGLSNGPEQMNGERRAQRQGMACPAGCGEDGRGGCRVRRTRPGAGRAGTAGPRCDSPVRGLPASLRPVRRG